MATKSVLIVDDAPETRIFLKGIVNSLGYSFFEAKTGLDALKVLNDHAVDLVILDVMMPNYDGYQTMEFINKLKQKRNIKVAFFSGKKGDLDLEKIQELKPDDLIHKTVEIHVLKTKLKKLIEGTAAPFKLTIPSANANVSASSSSGEQQNNSASSASGGGAQTTPSAKPAVPGAETKNVDYSGTITNMPIVLEIKVLKIMPTGLQFSAKFQFKEGAELSIDCPNAASALKKSGILQVKVQS